MAYLTESRLDSVMDIPVALPSTNLQQGDWLVISSVQILEPMTLTYKFLNLDILSSPIDPADIVASNLIFGNLGIVYVALWLNYTQGTSPGSSGAIDVVTASDIGTFSRDVTKVLTLTQPGVYSWIVANNCQPTDDALANIDPSISIDFTLAVTGQARLDLGTT